jgi:type IV fimbrial biogenesis protein FimT
MTIRKSSFGFTLVELMATVAIVAIVLSIAIPSIRDMQLRSQVSSITTDFATDIARSRKEAINRPSCVTICTSTNTANALSGGTPTCAGNTDWQNGWIIFANPTCSATITDPTASNSTLLAVRQTGDPNFTLQGGGLQRFMFDARGLTNGVQSNFTLAYVPESVSSPHYRSLCVSSSGRVTTKVYAGVSAC